MCHTSLYNIVNDIARGESMLKSKETSESLVYDVPTAGKLLNLSRATAYSLAAQGIIPTIRLGKRLVVPKVALERMINEVGKPKDS
jgi:hypothetical protein